MKKNLNLQINRMMELKDKNVLPTKLLVEKAKMVKKVTTGGIILPDTAEEVTSLGTVVLAGKGTEALPMDVKVGDSVMFPPRAVIRVKIEDDDYWLLNVQDILLYW